jgi:hypothetical protein
MTAIAAESKRKCQNLGCVAPEEVSFRLQSGARKARCRACAEKARKGRKNS